MYATPQSNPGSEVSSVLAVSESPHIVLAALSSLRPLSNSCPSSPPELAPPRSVVEACTPSNCAMDGGAFRSAITRCRLRAAATAAAARTAVRARCRLPHTAASAATAASTASASTASSTPRCTSWAEAWPVPRPRSRATRASAAALPASRSRVARRASRPTRCRTALSARRRSAANAPTGGCRPCGRAC